MNTEDIRNFMKKYMKFTISDIKGEKIS